MQKNILIVVTSADKINDQKRTGIWLSEFAEPYLEFSQQGYAITVASPLGGKSPIDESSVSGDTPKEFLDTTRYLESTVKLDGIESKDYDAILLPGGHGTMFDFPNNKKLQTLLKEFYEAGKIVAAVCHGPAGLVNATLSDGTPLVKGKRLTAFTDSEEKAATLDAHMPFLLESTLRQAGADFVAEADWSNHFEADDNLITGQNPQSTLSVAKEIISRLG